MFGSHPRTEHPRGQIMVLFAAALALIVFAVGLVVDGGMGLAQRREAQNASDFAAMAGARIVAQRVGGDTVNGTDANVQAAITNAVLANGGEAPTFGAPDGLRYVADDGALLGYVGGGMPADALGVTVRSERSWEPFFAQLFGVDEWTAAADATAQGGFTPAGRLPVQYSLLGSPSRSSRPIHSAPGRSAPTRRTRAIRRSSPPAI